MTTTHDKNCNGVCKGCFNMPANQTKGLAGEILEDMWKMRKSNPRNYDWLEKWLSLHLSAIEKEVLGVADVMIRERMIKHANTSISPELGGRPDAFNVLADLNRDLRLAITRLFEGGK